MPVNLDKPHLWKADVAQSVDTYNRWFLDFAPQTFRATRAATAGIVLETFEKTQYLREIAPETLRLAPQILLPLRMCTAPPLARDRLVGLADVTRGLVDTMEKSHRAPNAPVVQEMLQRIAGVIQHLLDTDLFPWLGDAELLEPIQIERSASVVADRLCSTQADPIIRNAQEQRQLRVIEGWLIENGYQAIRVQDFRQMHPGTFAHRLNIPIKQESGRAVNLPVDMVVMPSGAAEGELPLLIEAKSAGDFANTNKRRKEEAIKAAQLRHTYGSDIRFILFLCGYFETGYLGYEAAEGIDWVWEHRVSDLAQFGV